MPTTSSSLSTKPPTKTGTCCPEDLASTDACPVLITNPGSTLLETGQFTWKQSLLSIDALGGKGWNFDLNYLAGSGITGILGPGFDFQLNVFLTELTGGDVELSSGNTTVQLFISIGGGNYSSVGNESSAVLKRSGTGATDTFTLTSSNGNVSQFWGFDASIATPGRLKSTTDRHGNQELLTWVETGTKVQLASVTDSYGRTVTYRYYGPEYAYQLREVEDFLGRKLNLQYRQLSSISKLYVLEAVILPSVLKSADGNTYPGGTAYVFQFDGDNVNTDRMLDLIRIWYPNEVAPYLSNDRVVDVDAVHTSATPHYFVEYGQDDEDPQTFGKVLSETVGDSDSCVGGSYTFNYVQPEDYPTNIIDGTDPIVSRTTMTDRNGNITVNDFNANGMVVRGEVQANRTKNSLQSGPYVTWTKYNEQNQVVERVMPEGNSIEYEYEDGDVSGITGTYVRRRGLLLLERHLPGNSIGITSRAGSNGQTQLTRRYFYDPIFNQRCAVIEHRGNPIDGSTYWTPQNGGTTPTNSDRSRFATITYFDYQKNQKATVQNNAAIQALLGLSSADIGDLIDHVDDQMKATDGSGGIPGGFEMNLGDINGDGTGDGASSGLDPAPIGGNVVKVKHPSVRQLKPSEGSDPWEWATQTREEIFTVNERGQTTTHTDPEGNLTVYVRYPENDPEGDGQFVASSLSSKQYGRIKETHVDANPDDVMSLVGADGDLVDFIPGKITRTNTPGTYQDLTTRHEGASGGGCSTCSYDSLGNVLTTTDARGFTTVFERNELGEVYRTISAKPYEYRTETHYDANRNVTRVDVEDRVVAFTSDDPTDAEYAKFVPTGNLADGVAHVPTKAGSGGASGGVRPGWFTSLYTYDLLDNKIEEDVDATGSAPSSLVTRYCYDANQNLIKIVKPLGNTVEYDYDERDLRIAERVGRDVPSYESQVLASAPVAYWQLSDGSGTQAADSSGNQITATYTGGTGGFTLGETGAIQCRCACDKAVKLNGTTGYVDAGTDNNLNITSSITLEAWVKVAAFPSSGGHAAIISKGYDGSKTGYYLGIHNDGGTLKLIAGAHDTLNAASWNITGWAVDEWVHVAAAYTGTSGGHWKLFLNGDEKVSTSSVKVPVISTAKLLIGAYDNNNTVQRFLDAAVDQVAIYPSALTETQLELHYKLATNTTDSNDYFQGAVTLSSYDKNGNLINRIGATNRNAGVMGEETSLTATVANAFSCGASLVHTGDHALEVTYDGFDRTIESMDAIGNVSASLHDPDGRVVQSTFEGPVAGSPINRSGTYNVKLTESFVRFDEAGRAYENQQSVFRPTGVPVGSFPRSITHTGGGLEANSTTNGHTGTVTISSGGSSYVLSRSVFDRAGRTIAVGQDNTAISTSEYDGASRMLKVTDPLGGTVEYVYDGNSNVIFTTRTEKCTIDLPGEGIIDDEIFRSAARYDALNRLVFAATQGADGLIDDALVPGPAGSCCTQATINCCTWPIASSTLFTLTGYDSRGNVTLTIDPKGNTTRAVYDGAGRPVESLQHLRQRGQGDLTPVANATFNVAGGGTNAGAIRTQTIYDANSNVTRLIDDRGGTTSYTYDTLDRQTQMIFHDGSTRTIEYNDASDVLTYTDENGSEFTNTFDALGRKTVCNITPATGVMDTTTHQEFFYDGVSRMVDCIDQMGESDGIARVAHAYDSLGRVTEDTQNLGTDASSSIAYSQWTSWVPTGMIYTYPNNRQITNVYDLLYRRTQVKETSGGANIASWQFFGPARVAEVALGNGLICSMMNNTRTHSAVRPTVANPAWGDNDSDRLGYDGAGRMITKRFLAGGVNGTTGAYNDPASIVGFTTSFDKSSNKLYERHLHCESRSHLYEPFTSGIPQGGYDSLDRLREYQRGTLASTGGFASAGGGSVATPISLPNAKTQQDYALDGLGNWRNTAFTPVGDSQITQVRDHNKLNQITATKDDSDPKTPFLYDKNGNLLNDGVRLYKYDALNRLVEVYKNPDTTPVRIGIYYYDALGRRIRQSSINGGLSGTIPQSLEQVYFEPGSWRVAEERYSPYYNPTTFSYKQYVWGIYLDELIQQKNLTDLNNFSANDVLYPLQDLLYRTTGLSDSAGIVREAYDTDAYGNTLIFRNAGTPPAAIDFDDADTQVDYPTCEFIFTGQRWDAESELYHYKARFYVPELGRFGQRDIRKYTVLQQYDLGDSSPVRHLDAFGRKPSDGVNTTSKCCDKDESALECCEKALRRFLSTSAYRALREYTRWAFAGRDLKVNGKRCVVSIKCEKCDGKHDRGKYAYSRRTIVMCADGLKEDTYDSWGKTLVEESIHAMRLCGSGLTSCEMCLEEELIAKVLSGQCTKTDFKLCFDLAFNSCSEACKDKQKAREYALNSLWHEGNHKKWDQLPASWNVPDAGAIDNDWSAPE